MQTQFIVTPKLKKYLLTCYPEKTKDIYAGDINFLFDAPYAIDFPKTESKTRVKQFKARLNELLDLQKDELLTTKEQKELQQMMVALYVYELSVSNKRDFEDEHYAVFSYAPPLFDVQQKVIEYRMQNKEIFNKIHKYYYKGHYHNSIYIKAPITDFKNPGTYNSLFLKTHLSNDESFDLLKISKTPIPGSKDTKTCSFDPNVTYESEYYIGEHKGKKVLFCKQIVRTKNVIGKDGKKIEKLNVTLAICVNGNPTKKVCLLRYDYNPTDPHINRVYYSKATNKLTINTSTNKTYLSDLAYQMRNNHNSHLHKYDENVAFLFPGKSAENMAENIVKNFSNGHEVVEWFDLMCNIGTDITPPPMELEK